MALQEKDHEKEMALRDKEYEYETLINNLKWKLSHLTQKRMLETFYRMFWNKLIERNVIQKDKKVRNICVVFC